MKYILLESTVLMIAFISGLILYKRLTLLYRIIFFQLSLAIVVNVAAYWITASQIAAGKDQNTAVLYNGYLLLEFALLFAAAGVYFSTRKITITIIVFYILFVLGFITHVYFNGISKFMNSGMGFGGLFIVALYLYMIYKAVIKDTSRDQRISIIVLALGVVVYFAGNAPYIGLMYYLYDLNKELTTSLFHIITDGLSNVRYLCVVISFWIFYKQTLRTSSTA